jgi:uncharacterized protein (UPF0548 family)
MTTLTAPLPRWSLSPLPPDPATLDRALRAGLGAPWSYDLPGVARGAAPPGWTALTLDRDLGAGLDTYRRAVAALRSWRMLEVPWLRHATTGPVAPGVGLALAARTLGLWSVNLGRVAWVDEQEDARFAFGYGTLAGHALRGEECFLVQHDPATGRVTGRVQQVSLPGHALAAVAWPFVRRVQATFEHDALAALARAVS